MTLIRLFTTTLLSTGLALVPAEEKPDLPIINLSQEDKRHVVIAAGSQKIYQGHPTTVSMSDRRTIFC
ncbi:MAG: exo-alpha-sialidase, partial [Akkermansiaceae bacterium]